MVDGSFEREVPLLVLIEVGAKLRILSGLALSVVAD